MALLRRYLPAELAAARRERRAAHGDRPPRPAARRPRARRSPKPKRRPAPARGCICGSRSTTRRATRSLMRPRAGAASDAPRATSFARLLASPCGRRRPRRGSPDPHRRRKAAVGLPALGVRLRRALLHRARCGRTSAPTTCARRSSISIVASGASAALAAPRSLLPPNNP